MRTILDLLNGILQAVVGGAIIARFALQAIKTAFLIQLARGAVGALRNIARSVLNLRRVPQNMATTAAIVRYGPQVARRHIDRNIRGVRRHLNRTRNRIDIAWDVTGFLIYIIAFGAITILVMNKKPGVVQQFDPSKQSIPRMITS